MARPMSEADSDDASSGWEKTEQFYVSVGQGISIWALMEGSLVHIFQRLMRTELEKAGLVLYSIMNFHTWLSVISELFASDADYRQFTDLWNKKVARLKALNDIRTRLAHHTSFESGSDEVSLKPGRYDKRSKSLAYPPLTKQDIDAFSDKVTSIHQEIVELLRAMIVHASNDKSQQPTRDQPD
jgi:hypothetical protein